VGALFNTTPAKGTYRHTQHFNGTLFFISWIFVTLSMVHTPPKKRSENGYCAEYGHLKAFSAAYLQQISVLSNNIMEKECK